MARQQAVYGKRPRPAFNPVDIFGSPQNLRDKPVETFTVVEVLAENDKATAKISTKPKAALSDRKALGERNGNAVLQPEIHGLGKHKKKRSARGKKDVKEKPDIDVKTKSEVVVESSLDHVASELAKIDLNSPAPAVHDAGDTMATAVDLTSQEPDIKQNDGADEEIAAEMPEPSSTQIQQDNAVHADNAPQPCLSLPPSDPFREHSSSLLDLTAHDICSFSDWAEQLAEHFLLSKIAEASFGEVYRLSLQPDISLDPTTQIVRTEESVLKIIALTPPESTLPTQKRDRERALRRAANMSKPTDVASEVKLLQRLSSIPGFTNFRDVRVLRGRPGGAFPSAWRDFNTAQKAAKKDTSIFPDPAKKTSYSCDQLWAVIEMQDAGTDLERLLEKNQCTSIWAVWDIFWQVVLALAKGEEAAEFEHRDLHLGNICVRHHSSQPAIDPTKKLGFTPLEATLIDYTISRASLAKGEAPAFIDLVKDPYLFEGDSSQEYQYDIYRYMRSAVFFASPLHPFPSPSASPSSTQTMPSDKSWHDFHPLTNLVWLHYVLYMLLESLAWPSASRIPTKKGKDGVVKREVWRRANELERMLLAVQEILDPAVLGSNGVGRAGDLVAVALGEGWLGEGDIVGGAAVDEEREEGGESRRKLEELVIGREEDGGEIEREGQKEAVKVAKTKRKR